MSVFIRSREPLFRPLSFSVVDPRLLMFVSGWVIKVQNRTNCHTTLQDGNGKTVIPLIVRRRFPVQKESGDLLISRFPCQGKT